MKNLACVVLFLSALLLAAVGTAEAPIFGSQSQLEETHIAHAGGRVDGMAYTNSLEALESNYQRGFRVFELDFSWTADGRLVLIHDWGQTWKRFSPEALNTPTLAEFMQTDHSKGLWFLSLDDLFDWLRLRPDARVVTDVKQRNVEALQKIALKAPDLQERFIPQIYDPQEYAPVRASGFKKVLFTVYRSDLSEREIADFVMESAVAGLVVPEYRAQRGDFKNLRERGSVNIFVHTINDEAAWKALRAQGFHGVYTDDLVN